MAADGSTLGPRVTHFSTSKRMAKVTDNILNSTTLASRIIGQGKNFNQPTLKKTIKISNTNQGQFFSGLETLNSSAVSTTVEMEYSDAGYTHPVVDVMREAFQSQNDGMDIDQHDFRMEEGEAETMQDLSTAIYAVRTDDMIGLQSIVDDGTNTASIGGASRTTYSTLKSTVTASGGTFSLSKFATLHDTISDTGEMEMPTIGVTTFTVWSLIESLMTPVVRAQYSTIGYDKLPVRGKYVKASNAELKAGTMFNAITLRGVPIIRDKACPAGYFYLLNENYLDWYGRTRVPAQYKSYLKSVNLGKPSTVEGQMAKPSDYHGFFYQADQMMPNQAGLIGRLYVIGQLVSFQPRRHGVLTGVTSV